MDKNIKEKLSEVFGYILVAITCGLYVLAQIFIISPTGKTIGQILGEGVVSFFIGITINRLFTIQGVQNGKQTTEMASTMALYGSTVEKISCNINKLGEWCHKTNHETYQRERTKILARAGLKYDECFHEDGTAKPFISKYENRPVIKNKELLKDKKSRIPELIRIRNLRRENKETKKEDNYKRKSYWQAVKLKLTELHPSDLTSEGVKNNDPNYLGKTINSYLTESSVKSIVLKIFLSIVFGYYGLSLADGFSWSNLIWAGLQIFIFLVLGFFAMRKSFMFVTNDYRSRIIKKIDNLEEFDADIKTKGEEL